MSLPSIFTQPQSDDDWTAWAWNHAANHYDAINAAFVNKGAQLTQFVLSPLDKNSLGTWLYQHQITHNEINQALGLQGNDLLNFDLKDPDQLAEWLRLNGSEHQAFSAALGIG